VAELGVDVEALRAAVAGEVDRERRARREQTPASRPKPAPRMGSSSTLRLILSPTDPEPSADRDVDR